VLAFTPDVEAALHWFEQTHQLVVNQAGAQWMRTALPHAGGIAEQDARLMDTLDFLRTVHNELAAEEWERLAQRRAIDRWRGQRKGQQASSGA
jgi:hypothetical protein